MTSKELKQLTALTIGVGAYPLGITLLLVGVAWAPLIWISIIPSAVYLSLSKS